MTIKRILVPTDFSKAADQALRYAVDLARPTNARLFLLFVVEPVYYATASDLYGATAPIGMLLDEQRRIGTQQLARAAQLLRRRRALVSTIVETGIAHEMIVETARKSRADLIVMATHGRTGLTHLLLGSVTEKVIRSAPIPVLTVRVLDASSRSQTRRNSTRRR